MVGKILVFELLTKMLLANQNAEFLNLSIFYMRYQQLDFLCVGRHLLQLQIDDPIIAWQVQAWL